MGPFLAPLLFQPSPNQKQSDDNLLFYKLIRLRECTVQCSSQDSQWCSLQFVKFICGLHGSSLCL